MAIFEFTDHSLRPIHATTFADAGKDERGDIQRILRTQIDVLSPDEPPDILVIAEEFADWDSAKRRIDLLGIDKNANLVVIELKRTEDGGHMELQAIRYSAMVSTMTFERAVKVYADFLGRIGSTADARKSLLDHLEWDAPDEGNFAQDVRMILVSADFSDELTAAVIWLNRHGLDIRCIRMKPYADNGKLLVDVQQVIPLPEAFTFIKATDEKEAEERQTDRYGLKRFWRGLLDRARPNGLHINCSPTENTWVAAATGVSGLTLSYSLTKHKSVVDLNIDRGPGSAQENKDIFSRLFMAKSQIESDFGGPLGWEQKDEKQACNVYVEMDGGYKDEKRWPETQEQMVDAMNRLEKALRPHIQQMKVKASGVSGGAQ